VLASVISDFVSGTRLSRWAMTSSKIDKTREIRFVENRERASTLDA
jgi:hypothetical protein